MQKEAKLRVRGEPFFITGRGLGVIGYPVDCSLRFAQPVTVAIPGGPDGEVIEHVAHVEAARVREPPGELPGLVFPAERGSARAELLRALLRPGTLLKLTGDAVIYPSDNRFPQGRLI